jgi:uncharacterized protein YgbK (DUF1537 family)
MPSAPSNLQLAFYGDDFTGSTDALEVLTRAGLNTALFITPPTPGKLAQFPGLQAVGLAGNSRSLSPKEMKAELLPAFQFLRALNPRHLHYKVCSTFDSSPTVGSIGHAIDLARLVLYSVPYSGNIEHDLERARQIPRAPYIPLLVAAPALGRYTAFGNHFARFGIGSDGQIHRLDRHPSMSKHPITPSHEADLRLHLAKQTNLPIALFDLTALHLPEAQRTAHLQSLLAQSPAPSIILFDCIYETQLAAIGHLLDLSAPQDAPLFSVGSSGIEMALTAHWTAQGRIAPTTAFSTPEPVSPLLVLSGSCSPVTERQIHHALANHFAEVAMDTPALVHNPEDPVPLEEAVVQVTAHLKAGRHTILHTSLGPGDPRLAAPKPETMSTSQLFGTALGTVARRALVSTKIARMVIAGGDTSSYAAKALGIQTLTMHAPLTPGAPICTAHAPSSPAHHMQLLFKGGQVGADSYFLQAAKGTL